MPILRRLLSVVLLVLAAGFLFAWGGAWLADRPRPARVIRMAVEERVGGLQRGELTGLRTCLEAALAQQAGIPVVREEEALPAADVPVLQVRLAGRMISGLLELQLSILDPKGQARRILLRPAEPADVLREAMVALGYDAQPLGDLLPRKPHHVWLTVQALGGPDDPRGLHRALEQALEQEPACPLMQVGLSRVLQAQTRPGGEGNGSLERRSLQACRAAHNLLPAQPWLTAQLVTELARTPDPGEGLRMGLHAWKDTPWSLDLGLAVSEACRRVGLLEEACRVLERQGAFLGSGVSVHGRTDLAWLYAGQWRTFEKGAATVGVGGDAERFFLHGYACLVTGRPEDALSRFEEAGRTPGPFWASELSRVLVDHYQGESQRARKRLVGLASDLPRMGLSDGEVSFRVAEVAVLTGEPDLALTLLEQAYHQGFQVRRWYLESPFLGSLRGGARWEALMGGVQDHAADLRRSLPTLAFAF